LESNAVDGPANGELAANHGDIFSAAAVVAVIVYIPRGGDRHPVEGGVDSRATFAEAEDSILRGFGSFGARHGSLGDAPLLGDGVRFPVTGFNYHGDSRERIDERVSGIVRDATGLFDRVNRGELDGVEVFLVISLDDCKREVVEEGVFTDKGVRAKDLESGLLFEFPSEVAP
jgi:hypothetical protein